MDGETEFAARPGPAAQGLAALLMAALVLVVAVAAFAWLDRTRADVHALQAGIGLAGSTARQVASGDPTRALTEVATRHRGAVASTFSLQDGGVDDFGIARGTTLNGAGADLDLETRKLLSEHGQGLMSAANEVLAKGGAVPAERLRLLLADHRLVVAVPFVRPGSPRQAAGVAGVVMAPRPGGAGGGPLTLALVLLAAGVFVAGARFLPVPTWAAGGLALLVVPAGLALLLPPLAPPTPVSAQVLAGDLLVPHLGAAGHATLSVGGLWLGGVLVALCALLGLLLGPLATVLSALRRDPTPYAYVGPAVLATVLLIFVPFAVGVGLSFVSHESTFVGLDHYVEVVAGFFDDKTDSHFLRTLGHTVLWTVLNVSLHVVFGLALALVLNQPDLKGKGIYRVLLILPWAVPNYITALTWKWMFNTQYGPINSMLGALGLGQVDWLGQSALTNFVANLATNVWLGFPFMMVISLGALQSIPADLYEAASIDGASAWQRFRHVTLPLMRPALFPAIILGTIWTFNAFNIIYLVSGGAPDHRTDILITEAYYIFTVLRRTGLAAAYSVIIFLMLLVYTLVTNRLTRATEAVDR
jgi:ABC-type sugar transport system permease subunit